jgi:two-component system sensor histidine kinase/response regulator
MRIVNDFLNMSRLEQGRLVLNNQPLDLTKIIQEVTSQLSVLASEKKLRLSTQLGHIAPLVLGDADLLRQVLINLVGNAIKFTEHGRIVVSLEVHLEHTQVRVHDSGKGILRTNQALLFRKFQQAGSSLIARDASNGTGLGLYISKLMIEAMGGTIFLESSAPEQGSTFSFTLPLAKP